MTLSDFEKTLKEQLKSIAPTHRYLGEFKDSDSVNAIFKQDALIYIDFVKEMPSSNIYRRDVTFNLYIASVINSKNEGNRDKKNYDILNLLENIHNTLSQKTLKSAGCSPISFGESKKIFDDRSNQGYLAVYTKELNATLYSEGNIDI